MKKLITFLAVTTLSTSSFADISFESTAQVTNVSPVTRTEYVNIDRCTTAERPVQSSEIGDMGGAVLGTLVGGGLGSTIGKGNGKIAATAIGAAIGAVVGDRASNPNGVKPTTRYETYEKCVTESRPRQVTDGYNVTYRYQGHTGEIHMTEMPGKTIPISINVSPQ